MTRDRKKLFTNEMEQTIENLEKKISLMRNQLLSLGASVTTINNADFEVFNKYTKNNSNNSDDTTENNNINNKLEQLENNKSRNYNTCSSIN
jgi:hypothetical protein